MHVIVRVCAQFTRIVVSGWCDIPFRVRCVRTNTTSVRCLCVCACVFCRRRRRFPPNRKVGGQHSIVLTRTPATDENKNETNGFHTCVLYMVLISVRNLFIQIRVRNFEPQFIARSERDNSSDQFASGTDTLETTTTTTSTTRQPPCLISLL